MSCNLVNDQVTFVLSQVSIRSVIHLYNMNTLHWFIVYMLTEFSALWFGQFGMNLLVVDMHEFITFPTWFLLAWASFSRHRWCSGRNSQKEQPQGLFSDGDASNTHTAGIRIPAAVLIALFIIIKFREGISGKSGMQVIIMTLL